ncbi:MAG: DUF4175 domain-containing protein [Saprospiraceae bacterium]|nr:DUF4175 domain-containing protein [Saprospiraceae bacterium]
MQSNNYQLLIQKLDQFIRKFYVNNLIRGALYSLGILVGLYISFVLFEYYNYNTSASSTSLRKVLFYSFAATSVATLGWFVLRPMLQYFKLGRIISHEQAASIIGQHFPNVKDKLLNVLQLKQQASLSDTALIQASINQKTKELKPVPFRSAIDLSKNKKYLRYAVPPTLLFFVLLLSSNIIQSSTTRLLNNNKEFSKKASFQFVVEDENPRVVQFENYDLEVLIEGEELPSEVFIHIKNIKYKLEKIKGTTNRFKYQFIKIPEDTDFRLSANGFKSTEYSIDVLEKPAIAEINASLDYPSYTGRRDERIEKVSNLVIPAGTKINWGILSNYTKKIEVDFPGSERIIAEDKGSGEFGFEKKIMREGNYTIFISNEQLPNGDSMTYSLTVIPDLHPTIDVKVEQDTINDKIVYFAGEATDDYGIRNLNFHYKIENEKTATRSDRISLAINKGKQTTYDHILDVREMGLKPGDKLSYYFQVNDNDAVKGSKYARTPLMYYKMPTEKEIEQQEEENNEEIKDELDKALDETKKLSDEMKDARDNIVQRDKLDWQDRKEIEKLIKSHQDIEKKLNDAKQNFDQNMQNDQEYRPEKMDSALMEKQKKLDELFDHVMNDELRDLIKEMEDLLQKMDKEQVLDKLEEMEMKDEELEKKIDNLLNLFQQMEVEKDVKEAIQELDSLAKEQEELSEQTGEDNKEENIDEDNKDENNPDNPDDAKNDENNPEENDPDKKDESKDDGKKNDEQKEKMTQEEINKKQEELNKKFEEIQEKLKKAEEKNSKLEQPYEMDQEEMDQMQEEIQENMQNSSDQLQKKKNKGASKSQKNASKKMKQLSQKLQQSMKMNEMKKMEQDLKSIRQLLENLVDMSFEQEELIQSVNKTTQNTPAYVTLVQRQYKLKDDFAHVEDSLQALSKRVFQLQAFVTEKTTDIKKTMSKSLKTLEERQKRNAVVQQQYTMTGINDLALMLSESMDQMQQQMAQQMPGEQMCEKPGQEGGEGSGQGQGKGKKPGMGGIMDMQRALNKQLQQMKQQMKDGKIPNGAMSKKFAQMAAQQAAIRKALSDMKKQQQQQGKGGKNGKQLQELMNAMDKIETDLVNKRLPNDINKRLQDIETRLLEAENAEREREFDKKRKAERAPEYEPKMPPALEEYLKKRKGQVEMFKTVSPSLKPYYKNLVEEYFKALK